MQIQINTDHNVRDSRDFLEGPEKYEKIVMDALEHFQKNIMRIEVHFTDINAGKTGFGDKRCLIEARVRGANPVVATHYANNLTLALEGAVERLSHSLNHTFGKMKNH